MRNAIFYGLLLCVFVSVNAQELSSGISKSGFDLSVKPQDNFYQYVNGTWLETTVIPEDKSNYGSFTVLADAAEKNLKAIIDAAASDNAAAGSDAQKVGDMYRSFMDTTLIEKLGINPIRDDLRRISSINNYDDIAIYMAESNRMSVQSPFVFFIDQDPKNSTEYIGFFHQSGLGMPDKSYYFDDKFAETREKYVAYIQQLLNLANDASASENAAKIMAIETEIAKYHWTRVENRDRRRPALAGRGIDVCLRRHAASRGALLSRIRTGTGASLVDRPNQPRLARNMPRGIFHAEYHHSATLAQRSCGETRYSSRW